MTITSIFEQLRRDEGEKRFVYKDSVGKLTIGVGRNLEDRGLSPDEIDFLLKNDVQSVDDNLARSLPWYAGLDSVRRAVLINMGFNLGFSGLLGFHNALTFIGLGQYEQAAEEILNSKWAVQVGVRATRLALQLKSGEWQ